ncbi:MAG: putative selenate ABC transporter substrate-binding protein [Acidimicrobiia bacterium]
MTSPTCGGRRTSSLLLLLLALAGLVTACGEGTDDAEASEPPERLVIGGIPDQDPERLQRQFGLVADHLADELGLQVAYEPVADYDAAVSAFRVGDLDLVWFGGLTGVQARLQVDGARAIAQRDIDEEFRSVFIAGADTGIEPVDDVAGLSALAGRTFTFGSDSSTSGRLMPQKFLADAGLSLDDLAGEPGFSGSHDATIELVAAGSFDAGALNAQVWDVRVAEGAVDTARVVEVLRTPPYVDYHWVARPELGDELIADITAALLALDADDPDDAAVLELFGAGAFVETSDDRYADIEAVARDVGLIR